MKVSHSKHIYKVNKMKLKVCSLYVHNNEVVPERNNSKRAFQTKLNSKHNKMAPNWKNFRSLCVLMCMIYYLDCFEGGVYGSLANCFCSNEVV